MNIRFYNLGKIKETELELKPMTVIIGPNNSNKTYLAYSIYGLWQSMGEPPIRYSRSAVPFRKESNGTLSVTIEALYKAFMISLSYSVQNFETELGNFYQDSSDSLFANTHFAVELSLAEFTSVLGTLPKMSLNRYPYAYDINIKDNKLSLMSTTVSDVPEDRMRAETMDVGRALYALIRAQMIMSPYLMPAERNAFVITYKVLANRRLKLLLDAQRRLFSSRTNNKKTTQRQLDLLREVGEVRYPQPIEDFLELLFEIESEIKPTPIIEEVSLAEAPLVRRPVRRSSQIPLRKLASDIERTIQNGNTINFRPTALGGQEMMVDVGDGLNIDLYNASSSIKQLAPLLLYLRYRAAKGDLLIIDEPEMNLHPESQAKLLEVLAMLVNQGVYVLLTTHSPYVMSHLNNLAQTTDLSAATKRRQAKSLYLNDPNSLLHMDQISAYEMRDNQLHSLKDPDYGIRWDTLSDVSIELQQKYFQLYEEGHIQERAKTTRKTAKTPGE